MLERIARALLVGAVTLCLCRGALCAEGGGVLDLVGDDAVGVIAVRSVTDFQQSAGAFADAFQPGFSAQIGAGLRQFYTFGTDVDAGLNLEGGAAFVVMLRVEEQGEVEADEEGATGEAGEVEGFAVLLVPLADESAWREALGDRIAKDEDSGLESIDEGETFVAVRDGVVIACETADDLKMFSEAAATPLSANRKAAVTEALGRAPLAAEFSVAALRKAMPDLLEGIDIEEMAGSGGPGPEEAMKQLLGVYLDVAKDIFESTEGALAELAPSAAGINVAVTLKVAEGSVFAETFAAQKPGDFAGLSEMPEGALGYLAGSAETGPIADYFKEIVGKFIRAGAAEMTEEELQRALEGMDKSIDDSVRFGLGEDMAFAIFRDGETGGLAMTGIYRTDSAEEALEAMVEQSAMNVALAKVWLSAVGAGEITQEMSEETIGGVNVTVMTYPLNFEGGDPQFGQMMQAMYGDAMVVRMAAKDDKLYFTLGSKGNMERLLSGTNVTLAPEKVARSLDSLTGEPSAVLLYSLPDTMVMGMSWVSLMMMPGGQAPMIQAPPTSRLLAAAVSFDGPTARLEVSVPTEQINAAKMVAMQMAMQMQQQQQPGGPGGAGAPPWQPEAPPQ